DTFNQLLDYDALPIVNENDSVFVEELLNGDNDCLSANVAQLINADLLILLTDTDGLHDDNPNKNQNAKLISQVDEITDEIFAIAGGAGEKGTGGFLTKIKAAKIATDAGIPVIIMNGEKPTAIYKVLEGQSIGTYFSAKGE
ncbi:MAG: glutamate 5-kinase, partial [Eubacterium sp.]